MIVGGGEDEGVGPGDVGKDAGDKFVGLGVGVVHGEVGGAEIQEAGVAA